MSPRSSIGLSTVTESGLSAPAIAVAVSGSAAEALFPINQIEPWVSTLIAVATSSRPESTVFDQICAPTKSIARS